MTEKKESSTASELKKTDEVAKVAQSEVKKEVVEEKSEPVIYIGPTLLGGLTQYSVFNNGLSRSVQSRIDKNPELGELFIPVSQLPQANKELQDESSSFFAAYAVVKSKKGEL